MEVYEIDDVWGADLVEMQEWSKHNKGYKYMLNVIDVFSKFAWSIPLKDKTGLTVLNALKSIVEQFSRKPKKLWVDKGKEFYNKHFDDWLKLNKITRYSTFGEHKSAVVERFNRTLKEKIWKQFTATNTRNWINMIDDLIYNYNNTKHSSIKMTPVEGSKPENAAIIITRNKSRIIPYQKPKYTVGDKVRISRTKGIFEKGYLPNWSEEIFTIVQVLHTTPVTYKLQDTLGDPIEGSFYEEELQKTQQEIYRVEKVLQKKKINGVEHALVKWSGYSSKFNQWIPTSDLVI